MSAWFQAFARETEMPADRALDFELCLNELMSNVIRHGYDDDDTHRLRITLERAGGTFGATLEDDGRPFDPTSADEPPPGEPVDPLRTGGWGIPIVRAFASRVRYERRDGTNRVSIELPAE
jgi:anti-sigma regulatory factor (Ser/Thr protein kinase)